MSSSSPSPTRLGADEMRLLRTLPVPLAAVMMQQISRADRLFPVERRELQSTLQSLVPPRPDATEQAVQVFAALRLSSELKRADWQRDAAGFVERMTTELWGSGQIDTFRHAATMLAPSSRAPASGHPGQTARFVAIVHDQRLHAEDGEPILFRKLRPHGTFFPSVNDDRGIETLIRWLANRAASDPEPYLHWQLSGEAWNEPGTARVVSLSYDGLKKARQQLLARFNHARSTAAGGGPEGLRQTLLHLTPEQIGLASIDDPVLRTFATDTLTGGSGTQLYATTFVQWTIREALRRAQPRTMLARFTPRGEATSMDVRMTHPELEPPADGAGSLVDAEMGTYLSYLNLMRLPDFERACFLVWHEGYGQALLIGGGMPRGAQSPSAMTVEKILALTA